MAPRILAAALKILAAAPKILVVASGVLGAAPMGAQWVPNGGSCAHSARRQPHWIPKDNGEDVPTYLGNVFETRGTTQKILTFYKACNLIIRHNLRFFMDLALAQCNSLQKMYMIHMFNHQKS